MSDEVFDDYSDEAFDDERPAKQKVAVTDSFNAQGKRQQKVAPIKRKNESSNIVPQNDHTQKATPRSAGENYEDDFYTNDFDENPSRSKDRRGASKSRVRKQEAVYTPRDRATDNIRTRNKTRAEASRRKQKRSPGKRSPGKRSPGKRRTPGKKSPSRLPRPVASVRSDPIKERRDPYRTRIRAGNRNNKYSMYGRATNTSKSQQNEMILKRENRRLRAKCAEFQRVVDSVENERFAAASYQTPMSPSKLTYERRENQALQRENDQLEKRLESVISEFEDSKNSMRHLKEALRVAKTHAQDKEREVRKKHHKIESIRESKRKMEDELENLRAKSKKKNRTDNAETEKLKETTERKETQFLVAKKEKLRLQKKNISLQDEIRRLQDVIEERQTIIKSSLKQVEKFEKVLDRQKNQIAELKRQKRRGATRRKETQEEQTPTASPTRYDRIYRQHEKAKPTPKSVESPKQPVKEKFGNIVPSSNDEAEPAPVKSDDERLAKYTPDAVPTAEKEEVAALDCALRPAEEEEEPADEGRGENAENDYADDFE